MKKNGKKNGKSNGATAPHIDEDGFETIGGSVGKELEIGEVVTGVFGGIVREMAGRKKGTKIPFYLVGDRALLGSTVLRNRIEEGIKLKKLSVGDEVRVTRIEDAKRKPGMNPAKLYTVGVRRADG